MMKTNHVNGEGFGWGVDDYQGSVRTGRGWFKENQGSKY